MILGAALIILGPTKLPELARSLGKGLREFRKATEDFKSTVDDELHKPESPKIAAPAEPVELLPPETAAEPAVSPEPPEAVAAAEAVVAAPEEEPEKKETLSSES